MKDKIFNFFKRHYKGMIIIAVLAVVVFVVVPRVLKSKADEMLQSMYQTSQPLMQDLQVTLTGTGTITPNDQYAITPLVQGEIVDAPFEEGDVVKKGQLLYQFSTENAEENIKSANLGVKQAQQSYSDAVESKKKSADDRYLTSDQSGYVKKLYVSAGDKIVAGTTIADIYDNKTMVLEVPFNAADVKKSWTGGAATVYVGDESERLRGKVASISPTDAVLDGNMVVTYVTIEVKNPGGIAAGATGTARISGVDCNSEGTFSVKSEGTLLAGGSGTIAKLNISEGGYIEKGATYLVLKDGSVGDGVGSSKLSLESAKNQLESAKREVGKPFPKEAELTRMTERLSELNALLNMDSREESRDVGEVLVETLPTDRTEGEQEKESFQLDKTGEEQERESLPEASSGDRTPDKKLNGMSRDLIELDVLLRARTVIMQEGLDVQAVSARLYGNRTRESLYRDSSFLEVVLLYEGDMREEQLFGILNRESPSLKGLEVRINPIREGESGSLEEYLEKNEEYLDRLEAQQEKGCKRHLEGPKI